jgi:tRNA uridine 5-carbamoylmethylation protein Kti12
MSFVDKLGVQDQISVQLIKNTLKTRKIIAVGGQPGTGKTTLFRKYMEGKDWIVGEPAKLVSASYNVDRDLYVLGKYEEGETFAGTDRLSMAVQPPLQEWIASHNCNILFEGDRVFNQSFLEFCMGLPNTDLQVVYLKAPKDLLEQRYKDRGSDQSEQFLRGRETKYSNLLSNFELMPYITEFSNTNLEDQTKVLAFLDKHLG